MSAADFYGIVAAIYFAQLVPKGGALALGLFCVLLNFLFLYVGK